jgi:hypothetical protein
MSKIVILAVFLVSVIASAAGESSLDRATLRYAWNGDVDSKAVVSVEWNFPRRLCRIIFPDSSPKAIEFEKCKELRKRLKTHWETFKTRGALGLDSNARARIGGGDLPLAEISVGKLKLGILRSSAPICDTDMKNCHSPSTDPIDQFGFFVNSLIQSASVSE